MLLTFFVLLMGTAFSAYAGDGSTVSAAKSVTGGHWSTDGTKYVYANGNYAKSIWLKISGKIYRFNSSGTCRIGNFTLNGSDYYASKTLGTYRNRWHVDSSGKRYYYGTSGKMLKSQWVKMKGKYYHLNAAGSMDVSKWIGKAGAVGSYYVGSDGARVTSKRVDGYYLGKDGKRKFQYIFLGDSRMVGMSTYCSSSNVRYIAKVSMGYSWLKATASKTLQKYLSENPYAKVVLALGVNDLGNINLYISCYRSLIAKYPKATFYVLGVTPIKESAAKSHGYSVTSNKPIQSFNEKMKAAFSTCYLKAYSYLKKEGFSTVDGIHYTAETYRLLYNFILDQIK